MCSKNVNIDQKEGWLSPHPMVGNFQALGMPYLVSVFVDLGFWTAPGYLTMCWCGGFWVMLYQLNRQKV